MIQRKYILTGKKKKKKVNKNSLYFKIGRVICVQTFQKDVTAKEEQKKIRLDK